MTPRYLVNVGFLVCTANTFVKFIFLSSTSHESSLVKGCPPISYVAINFKGDLTSVKDSTSTAFEKETRSMPNSLFQ